MCSQTLVDQPDLKKGITISSAVFELLHADDRDHKASRYISATLHMNNKEFTIFKPLKLNGNYVLPACIYGFHMYRKPRVLHIYHLWHS